MRGSFQKRTLIILLLVVCILFSGCKPQDMQAITGGVIQEFGKTNSAPEPPVKQKPYVTCVDSDAGDEPSLPGTLTIRSYDSTVESQDTCTGESELMEYYCEGDKERTRGYNCKYGCREGRCLTSSEERGKIAPELEKSVPKKQAPKQTQKTTEEPEKDVIASAKQEIQENKEAADKEREEITEEVQTQFYNCFNGFKDSFETDVDCGGPCSIKCGYNRGCDDSNDCAEGLKCNARMKKCTQGGY